MGEEAAAQCWFVRTFMLLISVVICSDSLGVLCPPGLVLVEVGARRPACHERCK